jgi:hypothetical protein
MLMTGWLRVKMGRKGDPVAFHTDGKIILTHLRDEDIGDWACFDLRPANSGKAYHGTVSTIEAVGRRLEMKATGETAEEAADDFRDILRTLVEIYEEDDARTAAVQAKREKEREEDRILRELEDELFKDLWGERTLQLLQDIRKADHYYSFSDDHRVWKAGNAERDRLMEEFSSCSAVEQAAILEENPCPVGYLSKAAVCC